MRDESDSGPLAGHLREVTEITETPSQLDGWHSAQASAADVEDSALTGWVGEERKPLSLVAKNEEGEDAEAGAAPSSEGALRECISTGETTETANEPVAAPKVDVIGEPLLSAAAANLWRQAPAEPVTETLESTTPKVQPTSFIEKYSHLFADDAVNEASPTTVPQKPAADESKVETPRNVGIVRNGAPASSPDGEEESVEQYMAKLLQRVRGEPKPIAPAAAPAVEVSAFEAETDGTAEPQPEASNVEEDSDASDTWQDEFDVAEAEVNWEAFTRRVAASASPATDLGALRERANETARRAIGRHQLQKYRRNAVTKVIVSMLAGMTSLWLMLEAPSMRDLQFITACVSLVAAAYWAGEAFRAMLESRRAAGYEGRARSARRERSLPIDVE
jgi:hypothetical protein